MELSSVSAVVTVYNGEAIVGELVARLETVLEASAGTCKMALVNDGSRDNS